MQHDILTLMSDGVDLLRFTPVTQPTNRYSKTLGNSFERTYQRSRLDTFTKVFTLD